MTDQKLYRHHSAMMIIQHAVWLYHRFPLSYWVAQELLQERGVEVSRDTLCEWNIKFSPLITEELRHREPRRVPGGTWTRSVRASMVFITSSGALWTSMPLCSTFVTTQHKLSS